MDKTDNEKWMQKYYQGAVGFKVVGATVSEDGFPTLTCRKAIDGGRKYEEIKLEVSRDEEGNGPGFLFGLPVVK